MVRFDYILSGDYINPVINIQGGPMMMCFLPRSIERRLDWVFYNSEMKIWAVGCGLGWTVLKKVWADYEQLLREVFSTFCGQKFFLIFFLNIAASALKRCIA